MSDEEAWAELESAHTGIFTSLRADGWPVSLPVWFVVMDEHIYMRTPEKAKKVARVRNDDRACFLVERGERWAELAAVELAVRARFVEDEGEKAEVFQRMAQKYGGFRTPSRQMPDATKAHYGRGEAVIRLEPQGRLVTWDNAKLRLKANDGAAAPIVPSSPVGDAP